MVKDVEIFSHALSSQTVKLSKNAKGYIRAFLPNGPNVVEE